MRIDRDAAAVVADRQPVPAVELDLDARRMAGHRLVHCIVEDLGGEVVEAALVGSADIHPRPAADRFQPFQNLDIFGGISLAGGLGRTVEQIGHHANIAGAPRRASSIRCLAPIRTTTSWIEQDGQTRA